LSHKSSASDIEKCHFGDSTCLMRSINDLIKRYPKGIPEIGLPALDEAKMDNITILETPQEYGPIWMSFHTTDNIYKGLNNATITEINGFDEDPTKSRVVVKARIPRLLHEATYEMKGKYLVFIANTTGKLQSDFQNVQLTLTFKVIMEYRQNKRYLKIFELTSVVDLDRWIVWLADLYRENSDLTIALNRSMNENWIEFWNGLEPSVVKSFTNCFTALLSNVFENVAYDDMFLNSTNTADYY
ncbi:CG31189, partial [Drosophila busckii]